MIRSKIFEGFVPRQQAFDGTDHVVSCGGYDLDFPPRLKNHFVSASYNNFLLKIIYSIKINCHPLLHCGKLLCSLVFFILFYFQI